MIKIEFKEVNQKYSYDFIFTFCDSDTINDIKFIKEQYGGCFYKSVTPYIPTQDTYLDRSFILQQLGISKEQDEQMQQKYKIKTISFYDENNVIEFSKNHDVLNVGIRGWNKEIIVTYQ